MLKLLWLIPALPLAGFLWLAVLGGRCSRRQIAWVGTGSVGAAALITGLVAFEFIPQLSRTTSYRQVSWSWLDTSGLTVEIAWHLDALALLMLLVVTGIGFLIHLYSTSYMSDDDGYRRFFAYMNLFVAAMVTLVLADNLLLFYVGWEGVGLCSYLLIGFWYRDSENGAAAQKAFIVTRIGDTALAIGLFIIFSHLGTLSMQEVSMRAADMWSVGSTLATTVAALLLIGALGKSAQLPLHVWLPDAMAGPTPVSALIHAATMVTAGVYLIARMHGLFTLAPTVQLAVGVIGVLTLLLAAVNALMQRDIKRVLAYSTISQIGYMFLALGVGAWSAALFHFLTHACFKALLFLSAGSVILSLHHEQDMYRMGGLRRSLPVAFWTFLIGAAALSGVPLITSGFYSKDWILWSAWSSPFSNDWLWIGGIIGTMLTGLYSFRMVFLVFFGEQRTKPGPEAGLAVSIPLVLLALLALTVGFLEIPRTLGDLPLFSRYLGHTLPNQAAVPEVEIGEEIRKQIVAGFMSLLGIGLAFSAFFPRTDPSGRTISPSWRYHVAALWQKEWGFDYTYDRLLVRPWLSLTGTSGDAVDRAYQWLIDAISLTHGQFVRTQTGKVRWYAATLAVGALVLLGLFIGLHPR
ncbi:MAG: NADH-ubiquinone oxidoreductase chain L [Nitrospira sp.]|jgi:NADH-quinone oxidoreductase subunit L|nr:MAG: NADH-ubiquinone oxidoreductase chain L [Nitrospira sp.]